MCFGLAPKYEQVSSAVLWVVGIDAVDGILVGIPLSKGRAHCWSGRTCCPCHRSWFLPPHTTPVRRPRRTARRSPLHALPPLLLQLRALAGEYRLGFHP